MTRVTASEIKNYFGKYLDTALIEGEVYIVRHSRVIAKLVPVKKEEAIKVGVDIKK